MRLTLRGFSAIVIVCFSVYATGSSDAQAQSRSTGKEPRASGRERSPGQGEPRVSAPLIKISSLQGVGRRTLINTPEFKTDARYERRGYASSDNRSREWVQITVNFETSPAWMDAVTFQFYVLAKTTEDGKSVYSLYRRTIDCIDVARGRDHLLDVYLRPPTVARYGMPVAVHVDAVVKGEVAATSNEVDPDYRGAKLPAKWWENKQVLENEQVTVREGYLLARPETPFALINYDDYEVIR